jgi:superfamily II DNA/RNA helicase
MHLLPYGKLSYEWMRELIRWWFKLNEPYNWQVNCPLHIMKKQDVILTSKTSSGKSIVLYTPIIAKSKEQMGFFDMRVSTEDVSGAKNFVGITGEGLECLGMVVHDIWMFSLIGDAERHKDSV